MPPVNDNFSSAALVSGQSGNTVGSNVDATAEAGEPPNRGKTVWWKWVAFTSDRYSFSTRYSPGFSPQTDFETILDIYQGASVSALTPIAHSGRYAGWEKQSLATFDAIGGQTYYIRVDGVSGATGNIRLSWDLAGDIRPGDCSDCPPRSNVGNACVGGFKPFITAQNFKDVIAPAGRYIVRYCGGAWNYRDGWVVSLAPPNADQTWAGQLMPGHFFAVRYSDAGPKIIGLGEPVPPLSGYRSFAAAEDGARCAAVSFFHDGTTPIRQHFSDEQYSDNTTYNNNSPVYTVDKVTPVFQEQAANPSRQFPVTDGKYECTFVVQNLTDADFPNVSAALLPSDGISNPGPNSPRVVTFPALGQIGIAYSDFIISPYTRLNVTATIRLTDGQNIFRDLVYDLTPKIKVTFLGLQSTVSNGVPKSVAQFNIVGSRLLTLNLRVTPTGVTGITNTSGVPASSFDLGTVGSVFFQFYFNPNSGHLLNLALAETIGTGAVFADQQFSI